MKSTQLLFLLFISVAAWAGGPAKSNFTAMEVNHIRVKTPGLFNGRKSFSIHLDSIKENEYCFPLPGGKVISADVYKRQVQCIMDTLILLCRGEMEF